MAAVANRPAAQPAGERVPSPPEASDRAAPTPARRVGPTAPDAAGRAGVLPAPTLALASVFAGITRAKLTTSGAVSDSTCPPQASRSHRFRSTSR